MRNISKSVKFWECSCIIKSAINSLWEHIFKNNFQLEKYGHIIHPWSDSRTVSLKQFYFYFYIPFWRDTNSETWKRLNRSIPNVVFWDTLHRKTRVGQNKNCDFKLFFCILRILINSISEFKIYIYATFMHWAYLCK